MNPLKAALLGIKLQRLHESCTKGCNHATLPSSDATSNATNLQLKLTFIRKTSGFYATGDANVPQQPSCIGMQLDPINIKDDATACNRQSSSMEELLDGATRACDYWGDNEAERQKMRDQCIGVPLEQRESLRVHFLNNYPRAR